MEEKGETADIDCGIKRTVLNQRLETNACLPAGRDSSTPPPAGGFARNDNSKLDARR